MADFKELKDEELEKVNGGVNYNNHEWQKGDKFTTTYREGTFEVIFVMPSGLCYREVNTTGSFTDSFATLNPTYVS